MATVITVSNSEGVVGRCDAKCHNASEPECDCICGGRLHGVGAENAITVNTDEIDPDGEIRKAWAKANGIDPAELRVVAQEALFS